MIMRYLSKATSDRVSAACAVATVVIGVPSAYISLKESSEAASDKNEAEKILSNVKILADSSKKEIELSASNLAQMQLLAQAAGVQMGEIKRIADSTEVQQASLSNTALATQDISRVANDQLIAARQTQFETRRARLILDDVSKLDVSPGAKLKAHLTIKNQGIEEPESLTMWGQLAMAPKGKPYQLPPYPACGNSQFDELGRMGPGEFSLTRNKLLDQAEYDQLESDNSVVMTVGRICYKDSQKKWHRVDYCVAVGWESSSYCRVGNAND